MKFNLFIFEVNICEIAQSITVIEIRLPLYIDVLTQCIDSCVDDNDLPLCTTLGVIRGRWEGWSGVVSAYNIDKN